MSRKLATIIKDSKIPGKWKRVAEAYAAFANNDGTNIYPSQKQLGSKAVVQARIPVQRNTPRFTRLRRPCAEQNPTVCKVASCNKGAWHFTGTWGRSTLVYEIQIGNLQNAVDYLAAKCGLVNAEHNEEKYISQAVLGQDVRWGFELLSENQQLATIQLYQLQRTKLNPTDYIECAACHGTGKVKRAAE